MRLGNLDLPNRLILAPMSGITDLACRQIARSFGCGLAMSEMLSATGLALRQRNTLALCAAHPEERPLAYQVFGADEDQLSAAAEVLTDLGADLIDFNCGCPVRKVVKGGAGAALMREPAKVARLVAAMRKATHLPITVKMRSGWDRASLNACEVARAAEEAGACGVTVHPRTATQGFSGRADWTIIAQVKEAVSIPVIGNGDVTRPEDVQRMLAETGCDAVMIGRATLGNPWLFAQALALERGEEPRPPSLAERRETALRHLELLLSEGSTHAALVNFRRCLMWYSRGLPRSSAFREAISRRLGLGELAGELSRYFDSVVREAA
jgi:tRNA-dihydrouridine synthase B